MPAPGSSDPGYSYDFTQFGFRFSLKAAMPSRASSDCTRVHVIFQREVDVSLHRVAPKLLY